jgi:hypothetical protein
MVLQLFNFNNSLLPWEKGKPFNISLYRDSSLAPKATGFNIFVYAKDESRTTISSTR